jgi:hypothetical protein
VDRCHGNIDCMMHCVPGGRPPPVNAMLGPGAALPPAPPREQVRVAMESVRGSVLACSIQQENAPPTATITVTFAATGRVTTANVGPPFSGTPAGSCMARAVRSATVGPFSASTFQVVYPFRLH